MELGLSQEQGDILQSAYTAMTELDSSLSPDSLTEQAFAASLASVSVPPSASSAVFWACASHVASSSSSPECLTLLEFVSGLSWVLGKKATNVGQLETLVTTSLLTGVVSHARHADSILLPPSSPGEAQESDVALLLARMVDMGLASAGLEREENNHDGVAEFVAWLAAYGARLEANAGKSPKRIVASLLASHLPGCVANIVAVVMEGLEVLAKRGPRPSPGEDPKPAGSVLGMGPNQVRVEARPPPCLLSPTVARVGQVDLDSVVAVVGNGIRSEQIQAGLGLLVLAGRGAFVGLPGSASGSTEEVPPLFDSTLHGASLMALLSQVAQYRAPSLFMACGGDEEGVVELVTGALVGCEWVGSAAKPLVPSFLEDGNSVLFSLAPHLRVLPATGKKTNHMYVFTQAPGIPSVSQGGAASSSSSSSSSSATGKRLSCLAWGGQLGSFRLHLPADLDRIHVRDLGTSYAMGSLVSPSCENEYSGDIGRTYVVGLGGPEAASAHAHALQRTQDLSTQRRTVDRASLAEDRKILELAGVHDSQYVDRVRNEDRTTE